jgi:hypothetical protein
MVRVERFHYFVVLAGISTRLSYTLLAELYRVLRGKSMGGVKIFWGAAFWRGFWDGSV